MEAIIWAGGKTAGMIGAGPIGLAIGLAVLGLQGLISLIQTSSSNLETIIYYDFWLDSEEMNQSFWTFVVFCAIFQNMFYIFAKIFC